MTTDPNAPPYVPDNAIARLVLKDPAVFSNAHEKDDALVLALRGQLLVHQPTHHPDTELDKKLQEVATLVRPAGPSAGAGAREARSEQHEDADSGPGAIGPVPNVELWVLDDLDKNPIDEARRLRDIGGDAKHTLPDGTTVSVPSVSPNHLAIVSGGRGSGCPAGPPREARRPLSPFIPPYEGAGGPSVAVLDTGYIHVTPRHKQLDDRVTPVAGLWFDTSVDPGVWRENPPDEITKDADNRLIGIVGHGTFIAGQIAHVCPQAEITVVGHRDAENRVGHGANQYRLWASELSLANSLWNYRDAAVIQCGFAFPTLDNQPSLPFTTMMAEVKAVHPGIAVVSPAGNEDSTRKYWPAALPDVIGVAATKHDGGHRAWFSNWGEWVNCCTIGAGVRSTYIHYRGRVEDEHPDEVEDFDGWARWEGTSFAAPKVSAAIACVLAEHPELQPMEAYQRLISGQTNVLVTHVTDEETGVTLRELHLG